jgi:hypothetical protein
VEGAKGVQFVELALESWRKRCWVDVPPLEQSRAAKQVREVAHAG